MPGPGSHRHATGTACLPTRCRTGTGSRGRRASLRSRAGRIPQRGRRALTPLPGRSGRPARRDRKGPGRGGAGRDRKGPGRKGPGRKGRGRKGPGRKGRGRHGRALPCTATRPCRHRAAIRPRHAGTARPCRAGRIPPDGPAAIRARVRSPTATAGPAPTTPPLAGTSARRRGRRVPLRCHPISGTVRRSAGTVQHSGAVSTAGRDRKSSTPRQSPAPGTALDGGIFAAPPATGDRGTGSPRLRGPVTGRAGHHPDRIHGTWSRRAPGGKAPGGRAREDGAPAGGARAHRARYR
jgi:hypothetical protein